MCFLTGVDYSASIAPIYCHLQDSAAKSVPNGSCGFGDLSSEAYPGFLLAGVALDTSFFKDKALRGCGTCVEIKCQDTVRRGEELTHDSSS